MPFPEEAKVAEETLVVWRSGQVSWDPDAQEIVFEDVGRGRMRLADGDRISIGGNPSGDPDELEWLAEPDPSCPTDTDPFMFEVHEVETLEDST